MIRPASFSQGFLNRQTVQLLQCAGVPAEYFIRKQAQQLREAEFENIRAQVLSQGLLGFKVRAMGSVLKLWAKIKQDIRTEPFLNSIAHGLCLNTFLSVKRKTRVKVPESGNFIGVADPYGVLQEGQVFVQIRKDSFKCGLLQNEHEWQRAKAEQALNREAQVV